MRGLQAILSVVLAIALMAGATIHGARAAAMGAPMAMHMSGEQAEGCKLCGAATGEAAAQCAFVCAGLTGLLDEPALIHDHAGERPRPRMAAAIAGRFPGPEPHPPR